MAALWITFKNKLSMEQMKLEPDGKAPLPAIYAVKECDIELQSPEILVRAPVYSQRMRISMVSDSRRDSEILALPFARYTEQKFNISDDDEEVKIDNDSVDDGDLYPTDEIAPVNIKGLNSDAIVGAKKKS